MADQASAVFEGAVGITQAPSLLSKRDYLIDPQRFASEGNWVFCRFTSKEAPAMRFGFQRGGFNAGTAAHVPSPDYLQLHLELVTDTGAVLWLPSGIYPATRVATAPDALDISLEHDGTRVFTMQHWPTIDCKFRAEDGVLDADLRVALRTATVLPDCILPHCIFGMWEGIGDVDGSVHYGNRHFEVQGTAFMDHPRVAAVRNDVVGRKMYLYTTLALEDNSTLFSYYSVNLNGEPMSDYCFCVYVDPNGHGYLLTRAELLKLTFDSDAIANRWHIRYSMSSLVVTIGVHVRPTQIERCWGSPASPGTRREFSIIPLVLDGYTRIENEYGKRQLPGCGLAEYFNADLWPLDQAARKPAFAAVHEMPR